MLVGLVPHSMDFSAASRWNKPEKKPTMPVAAPPDSIDPITRTAISLEYASLLNRDHCPLGMYVVPSPENLLVWDAVFFVHQGYYADAIIRFRLTFSTHYPERGPPAVQFLTEVFHPLISETGAFNLAPRFRPWRPKEHRVFDVLHWIKAAFKKHALDGIKESDCFNKEGVPSLTVLCRYHETTSSFANLASQSSLLSQSGPALFDRDHHPSMKGKPRDAMPFRELPPEQLQIQREKLGLHDWAEDLEQT
ncbi:UBC-like protein [Mycena rebaudengoi]|nr:UBC-like protein [Mycena rebaudengoi]